jgi:FtsP/CotA-like multicopper oxidase with cupredoxin domain
MTPKVNTMLDHNIWCWNSRVFPAISPLVARLGERVRIRVGNLTMTNHPIHLHGHEFRSDRHRRRPRAQKRALARGDHRRGRGPDAPDGL